MVNGHTHTEGHVYIHTVNSASILLTAHCCMLYYTSIYTLCIQLPLFRRLPAAVDNFRNSRPASSIHHVGALLSNPHRDALCNTRDVQIPSESEVWNFSKKIAVANAF